MLKLHLLVKHTSHEAIHIAENDMIYITWRHATLRINVTGFMYLVDFLNGNPRRMVGFDAFGTPDDGYELWVQDVGLRLSPSDAHRFRQLLVNGLDALRDMGKRGDAHHLPDHLKLTIPVEQAGQFSYN